MANDLRDLGNVSPHVGRMQPDPRHRGGRRAARRAKRPIILGGRGVLWSGARETSCLPIAAARCSPTRCPRVVFSTTIRSGLAPAAAFSRRWAERCRVRGPGAAVVPACPTIGSGTIGEKPTGSSWMMRRAACAMGRRPPTFMSMDALAGVEAILAGLDKKLGAGQPTAAAIRSKELALHRDRAGGLDPWTSSLGCWSHARSSRRSTRWSERTGTASWRRPSGLFQRPDARSAGGTLRDSP